MLGWFRFVTNDWVWKIFWKTDNKTMEKTCIFKPTPLLQSQEKHYKLDFAKSSQQSFNWIYNGGSSMGIEIHRLVALGLLKSIAYLRCMWKKGIHMWLNTPSPYIAKPRKENNTWTWTNWKKRTQHCKNMRRNVSRLVCGGSRLSHQTNCLLCLRASGGEGSVPAFGMEHYQRHFRHSLMMRGAKVIIFMLRANSIAWTWRHLIKNSPYNNHLDLFFGPIFRMHLLCVIPWRTLRSRIES